MRPDDDRLHRSLRRFQLTGRRDAILESPAPGIGPLHFGDPDRLARLRERFAEVDGIASPPDEAAATALLARVALDATVARWEAFDDRLKELVEAARDRLAVESSKTDESRNDRRLRTSIADGAGFIDEKRLAATLGGWRGTTRMDASRRARVERAVDVLSRHLTAGTRRRVVVVAEPSDDLLLDDLRSTAEIEHSQNPLSGADVVFGRAAATLTELFSAARVAELELADRYDSDVHDAWLASFDPTGFTAEERSLVSPVIVVDPIREESIPAFFDLLRSNHPVHVITFAHPLAPERFDAASAALSQRDVVVTRSSVARNGDLLQDFHLACERARPSLHVVDVGDEPTSDRALNAFAALLSRAHPLLRYDPEAGDGWAKRLRSEANPAHAEEWVLPNDPGDTAGPVTSAELALLDEAQREEFAVVPDALAGHVVPLAAFLSTGPPSIAVVDGVDGRGVRVRLAVSRRLIDEVRRQADRWRSIVELCGDDTPEVASRLGDAPGERTTSGGRARRETVRGIAHAFAHHLVYGSEKSSA